MAQYGLSPIGFGREIIREIQAANQEIWWQVRVGGPTAPYWYYVEEGTSEMQAQPFIAPTLALYRFKEAFRIGAESKDLEEFMERSAKWTADEIRNKVPVRSGALRDSVEVERIK